VERKDDVEIKTWTRRVLVQKTGKAVRLRKNYCLFPVTPPNDGRYNIQVTRRAQECDDEGACVTKLSVFGRADESVAKASVLSISTGLAILTSSVLQHSRVGHNDGQRWPEMARSCETRIGGRLSAVAVAEATSARLNAKRRYVGQE